MATIKSYTDIEQSRKLAEILPLESADMVYRVLPGIRDNMPDQYIAIVPDEASFASDLPSWSLAALYSILPNNKKETTTLSRGGWKIEPIEYIDKWWCEYEGVSHTRDFTVSADNPIDAVFEMIIKLSELKHL